MIHTVLAVKPPWAGAIIHYGKNVENRVWKTKYRGPLLIHASKAWDKSVGPLAELLLKSNLDGFDVRGAIIGQVDLVECCLGFKSKWAEPFAWHWVLKNPRALVEPIPWKGQLRLFKADIKQELKFV